jgi:LuxR family transcriptional regulator, maltose regulon positive regulatory protein
MGKATTMINGQMSDDELMQGVQRPERDVRPVAASTSARGCLDVPIETKLHAPGLRKEWVERRELVHHLAGAAAAKLVLVAAPAGFGKTTLVAQWRSSTIEGRPFAWISLDRADDDPGRLWWHLICALQRACPEFGGAEILKPLRVPIQDAAETLLPILVNELAALPAPVVVVLDDYHVIKERSCHDQVAFLLLHLPPSAQIVLITRADPPLPLARSRAAGEMVEIRARELRFAPAEAAELVHAVSAVQLSRLDLADLVEKTEGWPAGVYLAALSLRGHPSPSTFVHQFTGDNRFIFDFLAEEVLSRQPSQIRQFLARTAILDRFCAPLCDAVTGSANAAEIIGVLERENLFVVPLDDSRQWFRYHHLFSQMLRSQLARTEPDIVPALHERASAWHRLSRSADEAIGHALAAGDVAGTIDLIARRWYAYGGSGQALTVRGWMNSLGERTVGASPVAAHRAVWAAALSGDHEGARRWLRVIEAARHEGPLPDGIQSLKSSAALLQGIFGFDGIRVVRESAAAAVTLESDRTSPWYAVARTPFAAALYFGDDLELAAALAGEALLTKASFAPERMLAFTVMSLVAVEEGRLARAQELALSAGEIVADSDLGLAGTPQSFVAYTAAGAAHAGRGQLQEARSEFEHALRILRRRIGISPCCTINTQLRLAPVLLDMGDRPGAAALLEEARMMLTWQPDGAEVQLARLHRLERRLAGRPRVVSLGESLTEREVTVLRLLRGTQSAHEIGQELYLSQNTIKTHTRAIYRKLGVSTRQDAVAKGRGIGIL